MRQIEELAVNDWHANPSDKRTGIFTSGIVALWKNHKIALFFTGRQHAGENLADVLKHRAGEIQSPIQMCDACLGTSPG